MDFFRKNIGMKVASVLLAVLLKLYFYSEDNSIEATLQVDIELKNLPASHMIVSPALGVHGFNVKCRVRGPSTSVAQMETRRKVLTVTLPSPVPRAFTAVLNPDELVLPPGVKILELSPQAVEFKLERVLRRELLVVFDQVGEVAEGYYIKEVKISPDSIVAIGPQSEVKDLVVVETQEVDVSGMKLPKQLSVPLIDNGPLTNLSVNVVTVRVDVQPIISSKTLKKAPVKVLAPEGFAATVAPSNIELTLSGPINRLATIDVSDLTLVVDAKKFGEGTYNLPVTASLPKDVAILRTKPKTVVVKLVGETPAEESGGSAANEEKTEGKTDG